MFFIISQVLSWVILPLSQILIILGLSFFLKSPGWQKYFRFLFVFFAFWYTSPITSSIALKLWEIPATPFSTLKEPYDIGIVLTGITHPLSKPSDRPHFSEAADRITDAVTLYRQGKIKKLLISGGSGNLFHQEIIEGASLKAFAIAMGVNEQDIFIEGESQNTRQSAVNVMAIIESNWAHSNYLLITSATHMRRASACFRKVGGNPVTFSSDINLAPVDWDFRSLIPNVGALFIWTTVTKEIVGIGAYWLAGYI